ncbi:hypothetical protein HID58_029264 [Brassica napus]|uniref:cellulase n=1 Tax=Brassica napus TaxID=3708 RepID=A0ABQ8CCN5_BRANA|nr:hypothetical protein HID58_029264 [Brassica napus]
MGPGSREISSEQQFHVDFCRVRLLTTGRIGVFCEGAIETERKHKGEEELSLSLKISEKSTFPGNNVVHQMDLMTDLLGKPSMDTISWTKYLHIRIKRYGGKRPLSLVKIKTTWDILGGKLTARTLDELMWGAAWLLKATDDSNYKNFIQSLGGGDHPDIFNWDNKYAGAYVLLSQQALVNNDNTFDQYKQEAESFICKILPNTPSSSTSYTPEPTGGLMYNYNLPQSNLQHVMAITFLLTTYAKYMKVTQHTFN